MLNHWLIVGLCLLFLPLGLALGKSSKLAGYERAAWPHGWHLLLLILDPLRAAVGAWSLLQGITPLVERIDQGMFGEAILLGAVTAVGALIQTFSLSDEDYTFAPFAYCAGVLVFFCGPAIAIPAIVFGLGSSAAVRAWSAFFLGSGAISAVLGPVLRPDDWSIPLLVGLAMFLPALATVMAGRHMGFPRR